MLEMNQTLFLIINAPAQPNQFILDLAIMLADYAILIVPFCLIINWLRGDEELRKTLLIATSSAMLGLAINQFIGLIWQSPRPFVIHLGHSFIPHVADSSFPSDHLTIIWSVAFSFFFSKRLYKFGLILLLMGLPVAWSRIYLGVHYPLDMLGALVVAFISWLLILKYSKWFINPLYKASIKIYHLIFNKFIQQGWIAK